MPVSKFIGSVELKTVSSLSSATSVTLYCLSAHETGIVPLLWDKRTVQLILQYRFCVNSHQVLQGHHPRNYESTNGEINVRIMILYDLISVVNYFWKSVNEAIANK